MKPPKFSIIIPAHNEEDVIERAIKSVQNQTFQNFEIIVFNDGSTDKTREIVEKMMKKDKRIRILNRSKGHSAAFARNRGAEVAKGEILVFLDADAYVDKFFLEAINKNKSSAEGFIHKAYPLRAKKISRILTSLIKPTRMMKNLESFNKNREIKPLIFNIKKEAFEKIGGYNEDIFYFEDWEFSKKFYEMGFVSIYLETSKMYFELPSTFREFLRQCKWIGKGINTIPKREKKNRARGVWFLKSLFLIFPIFFIWNLNYFLMVFLITLSLSYLGLILRNKNPLLSLVALPFLYVKTFLVTFNIIRFWR